MRLKRQLCLTGQPMDLLKNITQEVSSTKTTGKKRKKFMRRGERAAAAEEASRKKQRASDNDSTSSSSSRKSKDGSRSSQLSLPGGKAPNPHKSPLSGDEDDLDAVRCANSFVSSVWG